MRSRIISGIVVTALLNPLLSVQAQKKPAEAQGLAKKLIDIKVSETKRYTHDEVVAASGLKLGESAGDEEFKKASERLGETGVFSDVVYAYSYSPVGTKLELQLVDAEKFVPVRFENFVWFTDAELDSELRVRVPLFKGAVPVSGSLLEQLNDSLQALLLEKQLPGRVDYLRMAPPDDGEITAINFSVRDVEIKIQGVRFSGAGEAEPALMAASQKLIGTEYVRDFVRAYAQHEWLPVYLQRGNLHASFKEVQARVLRREDKVSDVEVSVTVEPGPVYRVADIKWSGNQVLSTAQLGPQIHLVPNEPANAVRLGQDLKAIEKSYTSKGYMAATIRPVPSFDEEKSSVSYVVEVDEGDQYKMGELDILGLDANTTARVRGEWTLREGEPYDSSYGHRFMNEAIKVLPKDVQWEVEVRESVNASDKTVDVNLKFGSK